MTNDTALIAAMIFLGVLQLFIAIGLFFVYYTVTQTMATERLATAERFKEMHRSMLDLSSEVRQIKEWFVDEYRRRLKVVQGEPPHG